MSLISKKGGSSKYLLLLAHIGALITVTAWGTSFLSTQVLMDQGHFTPLEMYVYRFAAAYLLILLLTFKKIFSNNWRDELTLFLCGLCAGSIYFITENYALKNTTAGNVSLLASVSPLFTTLLMGLVFRVKIRFGEILGSLLAFIGVGCVIFSHGTSLEINPAGDLLALSASLSWAIYTIAVKRLIPLYSSMFITRKIFFYGTISAVPLLLMQHEPYHIGLLFDMAQPMYLFNFLFLVVMCSMMAYIVWNEAMKIMGTVAANNYMYMQPMVTMLAGYLILGDTISFLGYLGCVLIIGGLVMADKLKGNPFRRLRSV